MSSEEGNKKGKFLAFFACSARFGKTATFLAAQPPKRSFDRPVRRYLRYLRARDVQSATLPLVYVTSGGSNLPVRPKKRPRVPKRRKQNGRFPAPGARLLALGDPITTYEWIPHDRFFASTKIPSRTALRSPKQQICQQQKRKCPVESNQRPPRRPQPITMGSETMD